MKILWLPSPALPCLGSNILFLQKINFRLISRFSIVAQAIVWSLLQNTKIRGIHSNFESAKVLILYICFGFSLGNKLTIDASIPGKHVMDIPGV